MSFAQKVEGLKKGDVVIIKNHKLLSNKKATIITQMKNSCDRYLIELLDTKKQGTIDKKHLFKININSSNNKDKSQSKKIIIKKRENLSVLFLSNLKKNALNLTNNKLMEDLTKIMNGNCIYIKKFYSTKKSNEIYNLLKYEYNNYINNKILTKFDEDYKGSPMICYSHFDKSKYNKNTFGNKIYFSKTHLIIVKELCKYFDCEAYVSLINYYDNANRFIPFHKDGLNNNKMNITIGISFGQKRDLVFKHDITNKTFSIPQGNGDVFAFTNVVNNRFKHSIPSVNIRKFDIKDRFSIIIFGIRNTLNERNSGIDELN